MATMDAKDLDLTMVNPFLGSTFDVFKQLFNIELQKGGITMRKAPSASNEIAIIIGITGTDHTGVVVFSMKKYTAIKMVSVLYPDMQVTDKDESFSDALGEIANIISGNSMRTFAEMNLSLNITTPSVIIGQAFEVHLLDQTTLCSEMQSPFGVLEINVAIKKLS
jgi:chemotaxis protein CheX